MSTAARIGNVHEKSRSRSIKGRGTKSGVENISAFLSLERGEDEFLIEPRLRRISYDDKFKNSN